MIDQELLDLIACPVCGSDLKDNEEKYLLCIGCKRRYPVTDGIPVLLEEEAVLPEPQNKE